MPAEPGDHRLGHPATGRHDAGRYDALAEFDAAGFPTTRQTLYLLSKDGGGSAAPLVAALTDRVMRAGVLAAEARGGRLDPPLLVLLDEAANICRIADLPQLYSHLGSRGIVPLTILQSYPQGAAVWGETGMKALWSAATVKVIGPGIDDPRFAEDLSRLIGDHDVAVEGSSVADGRRSRSTSLRQQRILPGRGDPRPPQRAGADLADRDESRHGRHPPLVHRPPRRGDRRRPPGRRNRHHHRRRRQLRRREHRPSDPSRGARPMTNNPPAGENPVGEPAGEADVRAQLRGLRADLEVLDQVVSDFLHPTPAPADGPDDGSGTGSGGGPFAPVYGGVEEWVVDYFAPMFTRPTTPAIRWCARWWDHAEAISRLEALWRSWEAHRLDPLRGMAIWYRDFLDHQLAVLTAAAGPFAQCTPDRHAPTTPLPTTLAPDGYWDDEPDGEPLPEDGPWAPHRPDPGHPGTDPPNPTTQGEQE